MSIPYLEFGSDDRALVFSHANGYPPGAYQPLLDLFASRFHVYAMKMRPLWPGADPLKLRNWLPLADDLAIFLNQEKLTRPLGVGHSVGATTTLRLALSQPDAFSAIILIDPVLMPPRISWLWNIIFHLGLSYRLHPLTKSALRRRRTFENYDTMVANYRSKKVFSRISDPGLRAYASAMAAPGENGKLSLAYSPEWEARIYVTGVLADRSLWRDLHRLAVPVLFLRGENSDTFWSETAGLVRRRLPTARIVTIPDSSHLVPLEKPQQVYQNILDFLQPPGLSSAE